MNKKGCGGCNQILLALLILAGVVVLLGINGLVSGSLILGSALTALGAVLAGGWYRLKIVYG